MRVEAMRPTPFALLNANRAALFVSGYRRQQPTSIPTHNLSVVDVFTPVTDLIKKSRAKVSAVTLAPGASRGVFWSDDLPEYRTRLTLP